MKPIEGYENINEYGEFRKLPAGIYGVKITSVKDNPANQYLEITCDIVKGEYKDYFKQLVESGLKDTSKTFRSYKQSALGYFRGFITAVEKTNPGYHWDWDETKLVGKNVIAVFGEEEYEDQEGNVKVGTKVVEFRSLEAFQQGKIKVPELKKLPPKEEAVQTNNTESIEIPDDDLPF